MGKVVVFNSEGGGLSGLVRRFLSGLLEKGAVDFLLIPRQDPFGTLPIQTLIEDAEQVDGGSTLSPMMSVNSAALVSQLTFRDPSGSVGVILRPCETRALIELVKLRQARLNHLILIGMECPGTYSVPVYSRMLEAGDDAESVATRLIETVTDGEDPEELRWACQICDAPTPERTDIALRFLGLDVKEGLAIEAESDAGEEILDKLGLDASEDRIPRNEAVERIVERRAERRRQALEEFREKTKGLGGLLEQISTCVKCHNCRVACPICYCRECLFDSATFRHGPDKYLRWVRRKRALRMPTDTLLYHITRMNHMMTSCVGCGLCESACPNDVPILKAFPMLRKEIQQIFEYVPGRDPEDELPLTTFREEELEPK